MDRVIITSGGGGFSAERSHALDDHILSVVRRYRQTVRPRIVFLPTASGDADHYILKFYRRFADAADCSHISLFRREKNQPSFQKTLFEADLIYVGGGSVNAMLGAWRELEIDQLLIRAYQQGAVLAGPSAGALCWSEQGLSRFYPWPERYHGLQLLPGSLAVHYTNEPARREEYLRAVSEHQIPGGYGLSDGTALVWRNERLDYAVCTVEGAKAYSVQPSAEGVEEVELPTRFLADQRSQEDLDSLALDEYRLRRQQMGK